MDLKNLTPEERFALKQQLDADERAEKEKRKKEVSTYEQLKDAQVRASFWQLQHISSELEAAKDKVFEQFKAILDMKKDLFCLTEEQMLTQGSHTFTTLDGNSSVIIGHNVVDGWSETVSVGIGKVNEWLAGMAKNEESAMLVGIVRDLLKPNADGVLKANRILDLSKKAAELGDVKLIEAVDLIRDAYRPKRTGTYIKAKFKNEHGESVFLPLSMSAV